ncbi:fumarylacetoacetate hydrolase family protein [Thalassotalea euphylliae]|uniref:FAA hydrolase family protein n=1 Tax=Thalassotalea euphylliae TaxID=1655234 RepID=A0A3E0UHG8_9GAMM|nr:fumarylacetoacetate hydrolase family protein [Thalassotalea euphylliae]REL36044.1 FAA hydrolase family protein [Thalassotalea euphylliae]
MKLLRFGAKGAEKPGILDANGNIRDLSSAVTDIDGQTLSHESLSRLNAIDINSLPIIDGQTRLGACVNNVGKFICIGLNYADHAAESNMPIPDEPEVFSKFTSAISGPNDDVIKPKNSTKLDWEVELAIVVGKAASYVSEQEAEEHIAGYCICNDISERNFQLERGCQWDKGKGCDSFGPLGPYLVTKDEVSDITNIGMWLEVNGKRYQSGNTNTMIFSPAYIVSYLSQFTTLQPGDVISTGTPPGVGLGQKPPVYLNVGDQISLGIEGMGQQTQKVVAFQ